MQSFLVSPSIAQLIDNELFLYIEEFAVSLSPKKDCPYTLRWKDGRILAHVQ